ncbi:MAG: hypothetical protein V2B18_09735 [Pseudomonadota bacterium]
MNSIVTLWSVSVALLVSVFLADGAVSISQAEEALDCGSAQAKWEQLAKSIEEKISEFQKIQKTPLGQLVQQPLVDTQSGQSISRQIAEAIKVKESLLAAKRTECRQLLRLEAQTFSELDKCQASGSKGVKGDMKRIAKTRGKLIDNAAVTLTEVQEVEGKEEYYPQYVDSSPTTYGGWFGSAPNNRRQQQMQYWGR